MDDVEKVARAVRPKVWLDDGLTAAERKQSPALEEAAMEDALKHITAYKAWLRKNGWVITRREATDGMKDVASRQYGAEADAIQQIWDAMLTEGEMREWVAPKP